MKIKPYHRKYPAVTQLLHDRGVLDGYPKQVVRDDLQYAEGIDIIYNLKGMAPAKFREFAEALLLVAYEEAKRYDDEPIKFAKFEVKLNRTEKGRKTLSRPVRTYGAQGHDDANVMVFGKEALGYTPTRFKDGVEVEQKSYLVNKVDEILDIADKYMRDYLSQQRPYKVLQLIISIRRRFPILDSSGRPIGETKKEGVDEKETK